MSGNACTCTCKLSDKTCTDCVHLYNIVKYMNAGTQSVHVHQTIHN